MTDQSESRTQECHVGIADKVCVYVVYYYTMCTDKQTHMITIHSSPPLPLHVENKNTTKSALDMLQ